MHRWTSQDQQVFSEVLLSPPSDTFSILFLLFNINGHISAHLSVGHATWTGYFLFSWLLPFILELFSGDEKNKFPLHIARHSITAGDARDVYNNGPGAFVEQAQTRGRQAECVRGGWVTQRETSQPDLPAGLLEAGKELIWDASLRQSILRWQEIGFGITPLASGEMDLTKAGLKNAAEVMK